MTLVCLAGLLLPLAARGADGVFPYPTHTETLDNGLTAVVIPMSSGGLVAYWTLVRTGSRDEYEPGHSGFAHFFEHMMFRGTERFPAEAYNAKLTELGANANAYTTDDLTAYHLGIAAKDLETVLDIESDRFKNLAYQKKAFETEAGAVYGEYRKNRSNPYFVLEEAVRGEAYDAHTYGHTTMGYEADIKNMPQMYDYSLSFFSRYYRPENVVLVIAGDVEVKPTLELVRRYYGDWKPGYQPPEIPDEPAQTAERKVEVSYPGRSLPVLWLLYKGEPFEPTERIQAANAVLMELAFGQTSDLYKKLRLEEQLVEFISAGAAMNRGPAPIEIITSVKDPARVDAVLSAFDTAIRRYQQELPDPERLAKVKSRMRYDFLMNLDTPSRVAGRLARMVAVTGGIDDVDRWYATLDAVTPEDVRQAARRYLKPEHRTVGVLRGAS